MSAEPIDAEAVARAIGTNPQHVRKLAREGRIPHWRVGTVLRFDPDEIDKWIAANRVTLDEVIAR